VVMGAFYKWGGSIGITLREVRKIPEMEQRNAQEEMEHDIDSHLAKTGMSKEDVKEYGKIAKAALIPIFMSQRTSMPPEPEPTTLNVTEEDYAALGRPTYGDRISLEITRPDIQSGTAEGGDRRHELKGDQA